MSTSEPKYGTSAAGVVNVGAVLSGKYRVEKVIGEGGMGVVIAATHLRLDEKVAIKLLLPDALKSPEIVQRFVREARAAAKIKSEHVARVTDVETLDDGSPYMVMEFLAGSDLSDAIQAAGPASPDQTMEYILQAAEAIAEAHSAGIVHRDLKPANLFLTKRADGSPCVKVLDFGISKVNDGSHSKTKTSAVMGSPAYMSPEQMRSSRDVDGRTDIWALGAIMYELLAGVPPFDADTVPQLCMKIMSEPLPPLGRVRADVPAELEAVIRRCQEKDAGKRFQHVGELASALLPLVKGRARVSAERVIDIAHAAALGSRNSQELTADSAKYSMMNMNMEAPPALEAGLANLGTAATVATNVPGTTGMSSAMWNAPVEPKKKGGSMVIAAVIAVAIAACVGAFFMLRDAGPAAPTQAAAEQGAKSAVGGPASAAPSVIGPVVTVSVEAPASAAPVASPASPASAAPTASAAPEASTTTAAATTPSVPKNTGGAKPVTGTKPTTTAKPPTTKPGSSLFDDRN